MNIVELKTFRTSHFDFTLFFVTGPHSNCGKLCSMLNAHNFISGKKRDSFIFFFGAARSNLAMSMIIHTPFSGLQLFDFVRWTNFHVRKKNVCIKQKEKRNKFKFYLHHCTYCTTSLISHDARQSWIGNLLNPSLYEVKI